MATTPQASPSKPMDPRSASPPKANTPSKPIDLSVLKQPLILHSDALDSLNITAGSCDEIDEFTRCERAFILKKQRAAAGLTEPASATKEAPPRPSPRTMFEMTRGSSKSIETMQIKIDDPEGKALQERKRQIGIKQDEQTAEERERLRQMLEEQEKELHPKKVLPVQITIGARAEEVANEIIKESRAREVLEQKLAEPEKRERLAEEQAKEREANKRKALAAREARKLEREAKAEEIKRKEEVLQTEAKRMIDCRVLWDQQKHLIDNSDKLPDDLAKEIAEMNFTVSAEHGGVPVATSGM